MQLDDAAWRELLLDFACGGQGTFDGRRLPHMPSTELQINTVGQSGAGAMEEAWLCAVQCLARFRNAPNWANPGRNLLDFGTGWARIARCFLRDFDAENILGIDVDPDFIAVCNDSFPGPRFLKCSALPPLEIEDVSIDFIVSYSVFCHLSETACWQWINESAILRPGGMAALTKRGRWFFDYAAGVSGADSYAVGVAAMFPNFDDAKAQYDQGQLVHSRAYGVAGGGPGEATSTAKRGAYILI